jgi:hypothetical protein
MPEVDPSKGAAAGASPVAGRVLDFLLPVTLSLAIFFGLQWYINSGGGPEIRFGMLMQLKILLICIFVYSYLIRRLLKKVRPNWWPN